MRPYSQKQPFARRDLLIQGDSVRLAWACEEATEPASRKPLRRDPPPLPPELVMTDNALNLRLAEELDYARRMLSAMGDELAGNAAIVMRHGRALQSVDIVGQMIGHIANVIRWSDPETAVDRIGMVELKARLKRRGAL